MSRMTATDLVSEIRLHLGGETTETIADAQILRWINRAYIELAAAYEFLELETSTSITTASGTAEYELSVDGVLGILSVVDDTNNVMLSPWSRWQYDRSTQGSASTTTGVSTHWFISGVGATNYRQMTLYPTPDGVYTLNVIYQKVPTELVLSPASEIEPSVLLEPWDDAMLLRAVSKGWRALGDDDKSYKALLAARDSEKAAYESSFIASYVPFTPGSIVGRALR